MNRTFEDLKNDAKFKQYLNTLFLEKARDYKKKNILEIELTNRCSIGCFYCGATTDRNPVFLDFEILCNTITHFYASRVSRSIIPHFSITGGDPLAYPYFENLLDFLKQQKIRFGLKLNPSTLKNSMFKKIAEAGCESVKLTFMGQKSQIKYRPADTLEKLCAATRRFRADWIRLPLFWKTGQPQYRLVGWRG
jgi:MoaA/NifB/PqqE/SkfB family radical SAM enzyme